MTCPFFDFSNRLTAVLLFTSAAICPVATADDAAGALAEQAAQTVESAADTVVDTATDLIETDGSDIDNAANTDASLDAQNEQMAAWAKASAPGKHHAALAPMAGTFNAVVTHQMTPDAPAQTSQGVSTNTLILGGRFLQNSYEGEAMGMPFQGMGLTGYDNLSQQYVSTWIDSMGTGLMVSRGNPGDNPAVLNLDVEPFLCPMTGDYKMGREVWTIHGPDRNTFEWFESLPDGEEFRSMLIEYTRVPNDTNTPNDTPSKAAE